MNDLRRWAAGLIGEFSQWLQDKLWPPRAERVRQGLEPAEKANRAQYIDAYGRLTEERAREIMARGAGAYIREQEALYRESREWNN